MDEEKAREYLLALPSGSELSSLSSEEDEELEHTCQKKRNRRFHLECDTCNMSEMDAGGKYEHSYMPERVLTNVTQANETVYCEHNYSAQGESYKKIKQKTLHQQKKTQSCKNIPNNAHLSNTQLPSSKNTQPPTSNSSQPPSFNDSPLSLSNSSKPSSCNSSQPAPKNAQTSSSNGIHHKVPEKNLETSSQKTLSNSFQQSSTKRHRPACNSSHQSLPNISQPVSNNSQPPSKNGAQHASSKKTIPEKERADSWHAGKDNQFFDKPPEFIGPKTSEIFVDGDTPLEFFTYMFPDVLIDHIVTETNRYAFQQGKHSFKLSAKELKIFLGINIIMTYIKYPSTRMYWSSISGLRMDLIANSMPVNRFEEIRSSIHFANNDEQETMNQDKFWKIRPVAKVLHETFHSAVTPSEFHSIDEMMVPFKGKSHLKQYIKSKPKKWGFKIWVKATSKGYVNCFELYEGSDRRARSEFGPTGDVVLRLCHDIHGKNHKLFMDNYFTSLSLLRHLQSCDIYVVGTLRPNRVPKFVLDKLVNSKLLSRGMSSIVTSSDNITIVRWMDNSPVHTISTFAGTLPEDEVRRWDRSKKEYVEVSRPFSIQQYNMFMGGVDLVDRMIAHYPHGFKSKKWYLRVFFHLLNMSLVNAWYLFKMKTQQPGMPLLAFKASVATSLINVGTTKKRGRPSLDEQDVPVKKRTATAKMGLEIRYDGEGHYPMKTGSTQASRCHDKGCRSRTRFMCRKCKEPVCPDCMESFHKK